MMSLQPENNLTNNDAERGAEQALDTRVIAFAEQLFERTKQFFGVPLHKPIESNQRYTLNAEDPYVELVCANAVMYSGTSSLLCSILVRDKVDGESVRGIEYEHSLVEDVPHFARIFHMEGKSYVFAMGGDLPSEAFPGSERRLLESIERIEKFGKGVTVEPVVAEVEKWLLHIPKSRD